MIIPIRVNLVRKRYAMGKGLYLKLYPGINGFPVWNTHIILKLVTDGIQHLFM